MSEHNYGSEGNEGDGRRHVHVRDERPYWKRMHRSWPFWAGMILALAAIAIYVLSDNLALIPRRTHQPIAGQLGQ
jgi:anti-sigma-K factor RskA